MGRTFEGNICKYTKAKADAHPSNASQCCFKAAGKDCDKTTRLSSRLISLFPSSSPRVLCYLTTCFNIVALPFSICSHLFTTHAKYPHLDPINIWNLDKSRQRKSNWYLAHRDNLHNLGLHRHAPNAAVTPGCALEVIQSMSSTHLSWGKSHEGVQKAPVCYNARDNARVCTLACATCCLKRSKGLLYCANTS